jgi:SAM-dependent methyltransferase
MPTACRICGNQVDNQMHRAREMMFGTRDEFDYLECGSCGTLQIVDVPDLAKYYPDDYFSFRRSGSVDLARTLPRRIAARFAGKYLLTGRGYIGRLIVTKKPWVEYFFPPSLADPLLEIGRGSRILDVGCGDGGLLQALHYYGFTDLEGCDPFIERDVTHATGVRIFKLELSELEPFYDLVMLHHSFEHLHDPRGSLREIHRLLPPGKFALIRMPVVNIAWQEYGVDWVQLDPPRHLFLYTERAFRDLAGELGFSVEKVVYDSTAFQFWGSEQYRRNIPLNYPRSHNDPTVGTLFSPVEMVAWIARSEFLNEQGKGDQACFYLRKIG